VHQRAQEIQQQQRQRPLSLDLSFIQQRQERQGSAPHGGLGLQGLGPQGSQGSGLGSSLVPGRPAAGAVGVGEVLAAVAAGAAEGPAHMAGSRGLYRSPVLYRTPVRHHVLAVKVSQACFTRSLVFAV
jgi:hypothetical protein